MAEVSILEAQAGTAPTAAGEAAVAERELTSTDIELLLLLAQGVPMDTIARRLYTSCRTNRRRIRALCDKLGVGTPIEAVVWAARRGYL